MLLLFKYKKVGYWVYINGDLILAQQVNY